jgi:hypothetical protein
MLPLIFVLTFCFGKRPCVEVTVRNYRVPAGSGRQTRVVPADTGGWSPADRGREAAAAVAAAAVGPCTNCSKHCQHICRPSQYADFGTSPR